MGDEIIDILRDLNKVERATIVMVTHDPRRLIRQSASCGCLTGARFNRRSHAENYLKMAVKVLLRRKFFTFISLFGIAFTLIVLMVVVALFDHIFAPFPPEVNQERTLFCLRLNGRGPHALNSGPDLDCSTGLRGIYRTLKQLHFVLRADQRLPTEIRQGLDSYKTYGQRVLENFPIQFPRRCPVFKR